jgi:signal transduction histidine kinase
MTLAAALDTQLADELSGLARTHAESQAFVALLAHELRTRLKVTERGLLEPDGGGREEALANTLALEELVEGLLDLARGGSGEQGDAGVALRWIVQDLGDEIEWLGAEILVHELPGVSLPQPLLETVLRNLVVNALEAGASSVEVFARAGGSICVRDDGPGVPPGSAARVFEAYSTKFGNSGLGLALCRELVRSRGGDLWLEAPSTFCLTLP